MAVSAAAVTAKLVALTLSDWNGRTVVFSVIAALVTPVILIVTMIMCTLSGTVDHNISAVQLSFHGGYLSSKVPAEYRMYIENGSSRRSRSLPGKSDFLCPVFW